MECLEFFAGIGGFATAFPHLHVRQAVDIDRDASFVYQANHSHPYHIAEIASLPNMWFERHQADFWWMSPPCTPFTRKGKQKDLADPRCDALKRLVQAVVDFRPERVAIENVVGFETSQAFVWLSEKWCQAGYQIHWTTHCPSELGWPNRRPRFYAIASRSDVPPLNNSVHSPRTQLLEDVLPEIKSFFTSDDQYTNNFDIHSSEARTSIQLRRADFIVPLAVLKKFESAIHLIELEKPANTRSAQITTCFTSSYGKSVVRSGSYLKLGNQVRRFSPREVASLLGFPDTFILPASFSSQRLWHLLGNSLSLLSVRQLYSPYFE